MVLLLLGFGGRRARMTCEVCLGSIDRLGLPHETWKPNQLRTTHLSIIQKRCQPQLTTPIRPTALTSGKTPSRITWSRKVLQWYPLYHTLSYRNHCDPLYLAFYCSDAKGRCGADDRAREEVEEAAVRGKACQLFFRIKNAITHKPKIQIKF
jgi:hypothetical protein